MQRRVRQHDAEIWVRRRYAGALSLRRCKHNWPSARLQLGFRERSQFNESGRRRNVRHHHGKRSRLSILAVSKRFDHSDIPRIARQVIPADSLDSDDGALANEMRRRCDGITTGSLL